MLKITREHLPLFDQLEVGISLLTWHPEDLEKIDWVFVNDYRCAMTGFTREEIVSRPITVRSTREARSIYENYKAHVTEHGSYSCETMLLHKTLRAIPVTLHMKLVELDGEVHLLSELHDLSEYKRTEEQLEHSRESLQQMLALLEQEKAKITGNIERNLASVLFPLMNQLRVSATDAQREVLDLMARRINDVCRETGVSTANEFLSTKLTRRQILVCEMIRDGMTSKEIAGALNCSPSTINNHRNAIRKKLNLSGRGANLEAYLNSRRGQERK